MRWSVVEIGIVSVVVDGVGEAVSSITGLRLVVQEGVVDKAS